MFSKLTATKACIYTLTAFVEFTQFKTFPSLRCAQMPYMEQYPSAGTTLREQTQQSYHQLLLLKMSTNGSINT
jgi:hypothetical protein